MTITKNASAGTLESSDVLVTILPSSEAVSITVESDVEHQYGNHIKALIAEVLDKYAIRQAEVRVVDKGALDCTLIARTETALHRAAGKAVPVKWGA